MGYRRPKLQALLRQVGLLARGESAAAPIGITLGLVLVCALAGSSWWLIETCSSVNRQASLREMEATGVVLSHSAEALLSAGELSLLRRAIVEISRDRKLSRCRVVLPNGQVVADADPREIDVKQLPDKWPESPPDSAEPDRSADGATRTYRLTIAGAGAARLEIAGNVPPSSGSPVEARAGMAVISCLSLAALLWAYRRIRSRLRGYGAIREALLARRDGERAASVLRVSDDLGPEACSWNEYLNEHDVLQKELALAKAEASPISDRGAPGSLEKACDAMSHGLLLVAEDLSVRYSNGAAAGFLKTKRQEIIGSPIERFIGEERVLAAARAMLAGEITRPTAVEVENAESGGILRYNVRPVRRDDSVSGMITIEDVTQKRVAEKATSAFVGQATHELRAPLTNIRLYVESIMEDGAKDPSRLAECLNVISQEAARLEHMVSDILSVADIEAGSFTLRKDDVRFASILPELEADYKLQAKQKGIGVAFELPPKIPVVQGDRDKLVLCLHNLLSNAIKYTPSGGEVKVTAKVVQNELSVEVADSGIGISDAELERVFERFYRADDPRVRKTTGSGLGLAISREIARLHGGDIVAHSVPDEGSSFTLKLPLGAGEK